MKHTALWMERREEQGYPLGLVPAAEPPKSGVPQPPASDAPRDFVLEIGSEELPPDDVLLGMAQLRWAFEFCVRCVATNFVLEIGSKELPPDDVLLGMAQLRWAWCIWR